MPFALPFPLSLAIAVLAAALCIMFLIMGGSDLASSSKVRWAGAKGAVTGMVHHRFMQQYDKTGEIPKAAYQYWGRTTVHGGKFAFFSALSGNTWYPCVQYEAGGKPVISLSPYGFKKDSWQIGQPVQVLYERDNPQNCRVGGDREVHRQATGSFIAAGVCAVVAVVLIAVTFL